MLTLMVKTVEQTFAVCSVLMRSAPGFTSPRSNDWDRVSESVHKSHSAGTLRTVECLYSSAVFALIAGQEVREWSGGWVGGGDYKITGARRGQLFANTYILSHNENEIGKTRKLIWGTERVKPSQ